MQRFPPKTPMQMRRESQERTAPKNPAPAPRLDSSRYPPQHRDTADQIDATIDWLAHLAAGRIQVR